jgi:xanthine dehydrogenase large subunit
MLLTENILGTVAPKLGLTGEQIRERNFYTSEQQTTPYGQRVRHVERLHEVWSQVMREGDFAARERAIAQFNATHEHVKRAIAATPVKFGISFNQTSMNQGGALVLIYKDGSVLVNHGGTEMGQGLHTKMLQVAATALGLPLSKVRLAPTRTDKVPNTSATSASTGADLNGGAVKNACDQIKERLAVVAGGLLGVPPADVRFGGGTAYGLNSTREPIPWEELVRTAYVQRVQLHAAGYYRTEGLDWNEQTFHGSPFKYFSYGAAVAEVEVDGFTGAYRTRRVDIVHDVGTSLSPLIDQGQIEGAFVQGAGWLTLEDQRWDAGDGPTRGRLSTQAASTYKLPSFSEMPEVFNVSMSQNPEEGVIYGGKAVGEPPLMLPFSVREALRKAAAAFGPVGISVHLASPATPEAVYWAIEDARAASPNGVLKHEISNAVPRSDDKQPVPSGV